MTIEIIRKSCSRCKSVEGEAKFKYGNNVCNKCQGQENARKLALKKENQTEFEKFYSNERIF